MPKKGIAIGLCAVFVWSIAISARSQVRGEILDRNGVVLAKTASTGHRLYPEADLAGHLTGYLGKKGTVGIGGLEESFDQFLAQGNSLLLTVDARLQRLVRESFPTDKNGAVAVVDPNTGAILALASFPGFDPNDFSPSITREKWLTYLQDPRKPLFARTIHSYIPGSVYKIPAALAATSAGLADRVFVCDGGVKIGNRRLKCWGVHGELDLSAAIKHSCNAAFYQIANETGIEPIENTARLLGLLDPTGCGLPGETSDQSSGEFRRLKNKSVTSADRALAAIGQGAVTASPLQLASMTATFANGGLRYQPHLIQRDQPELIAGLVQSGYSAEHFETIRQAMWRVVNESGGTAFHLKSDQVQIAGKSGSAQTGKPGTSTHAWFIAFAPFENPKLAVCTFVEEGGPGSKTAGPIAREILLQGLSLMNEN